MYLKYEFQENFLKENQEFFYTDQNIEITQDERIDVWYIQTVECYSSMKRN